MPTHSKGNNVTKTISLPADLDQAVKNRIESIGMKNFSEYARKLFERDLAEQGAIVYESKGADAPPPEKPTNGKPVRYPAAKKSKVA